MGGVTRAWRRVVGVPATAALVIGGVSATLLVTSVTPASAAGPCTVTLATGGAGAGEFRGAINSANAGNCLVGSNEVINITAGLTISLNVQQALYNNGTDPLVINGNGSTITTGGGNRILVVSSPQLVTINNLTLQNGVANGNRGGAIRTDVGGITLNGDTFNNNTSGTGGGAVSVESGNVTVSGSTFTGNRVTGTGGIFPGGAIRAHHSGGTANTFTITNSTFTNNSEAGDDGGAVWADVNFTVQISGSTFTGNRAGTDDGGAVDITGAPSLTISTSTFQNNSAADDGGAIDCETTGGVVTITASTFAGNSTDAHNGASSGGAIDLENPCTLKLVNSTITTSTSGDDAAITAEAAPSPVTLVYDTIVNNATFPATPGAAAAPAPDNDASSGQVGAKNENTPVATANLEVITPAQLTVFGTVFGRPHGGPNCSDATGAPLTGINSAGYNLADDTSCGLTTATDKQASGLDPKVGGLANNGGPTQTLLPLTGSPLIDAIAVAACQSGPAAGITTDQRGVARPQGAGCDIGAVEVIPPLVVQPRFTG